MSSSSHIVDSPYGLDGGLQLQSLSDGGLEQFDGAARRRLAAPLPEDALVSRRPGDSEITRSQQDVTDCRCVDLWWRLYEMFRAALLPTAAASLQCERDRPTA